MRSLQNTLILALVWITMAFTSSTLNSEPKGIRFENKSWKEIVALAQKEKKIIYLNVYASWCGPCNRLKKKTFTDHNVGDFYNSNFINISFDGELGEGISISEKYNVNSYPTHIFIDSNGKLIAQTTGYHNAKNFIKIGESAINQSQKNKK